jgi:hypothetical protein
LLLQRGQLRISYSFQTLCPVFLEEEHPDLFVLGTAQKIPGFLTLALREVVIHNYLYRFSIHIELQSIAACRVNFLV